MSPIGSLKQSAMMLSLLATTVFGGVVAPHISASASSEPHYLMQLSDSGFGAAEQPQEVNRVAVLATALAGSVAIGMGLTALHDRTAATQSRTKPDRAISLTGVNQRLQRRLLTLLHDDRAAATRLITQASFKYPGQAPNWYVEKVIYDLERDRGKY